MNRKPLRTSGRVPERFETYSHLVPLDKKYVQEHHDFYESHMPQRRRRQEIPIQQRSKEEIEQHITKELKRAHSGELMEEIKERINNIVEEGKEFERKAQEIQQKMTEPQKQQLEKDNKAAEELGFVLNDHAANVGVMKDGSLCYFELGVLNTDKLQDAIKKLPEKKRKKATAYFKRWHEACNHAIKYRSHPLAPYDGEF